MAAISDESVTLLDDERLEQVDLAEALLLSGKRMGGTDVMELMLEGVRCQTHLVVPRGRGQLSV